MTAPAIGTGRAVEVLHDRGPATSAGGDRWTCGSGYLIGSRLVLTVAYNVDYRRDLGDGEQLLVRTIEGNVLTARVVLVCDELSEVDLALLEISDPSFGDLQPVTFARVNRDSPAPVAGCWAVGFPLFAAAGSVLPDGSRKEIWQVSGHILAGGKRRAGLLSLQVTSTPRPLPASLADSAWEGMSGAVVFAADGNDHEQAAVGVISTHHRPEGESALTVVPITAVANLAAAAEWWQQFSVSDPGALPILPRQRARAGAEVMTALPDPGRSRAVLIGASTYRHLADLPAVRNNLSGFRDVLIAPALGGLPADNCTIVAEPARPVDVYRMLRQHAKAAEDTLLVYFVGHGRIGDRNELFLCLPDTDPDELPYSAWPYDELRRVVADSCATKKVVILDCCFSGRALADQAGDEETILGQVGIEGTYILTATAANAVALAPPGKQYTAFTGTLLGLLTKGIPDGPELLTFGQIYPRLQYALTSRQLPRPRQQGSDTIAHLALTRNLAYTRRGGTIRSFNERFTAITAQLGDAQPAVRLADVHAMADLADDWEENRQTCIDALCAYLRMPYEPDPGDAPPAERVAYWASREVRHTAIQVITAHLKDGAAVSWQGLNFDFTGVVFDGGDFADARFSGGEVSFNGAVFSGAEVSFNGAVFSGGRVSFDGAVFSGGWVDFAAAVFSGGHVSFTGARFSRGHVVFGRAKFSGAYVSFVRAVFSGGTVNFADAEFSSGKVSFIRAVFSRGHVVFVRAKFSAATVGFLGAVFSGGRVNFGGAEFDVGAAVFFNSARFSGGEVGFLGAVFSGGKVNFVDARFDGGTVDFAHPQRWSHPPVFGWDGEPPAGVVLPVQPFEETRSQPERG